MADRVVLGLCGSLRQGSLNAALLRLVQRVGTGITVVGGDVAGRLPLFNPDVENDEGSWPASVRELRDLAARAEGVVVATPEYAHGPAGVTKNAIDWLVGSAGLAGKPTLLVSASPGQAGGMRAHAPLMPTLTLLGAVLVELRGRLPRGLADGRRR
ncbi:NADPH-dependent FMN reductase [Nocardiopsis codii]|uniref:NADPH-dependent FMN reductase n=1 Tax=Nocardiopsis codii TaxID=3065942 RepID=UPI002E7BED58|nr:NADPH-dependent FMN reductase [Nocardiopsis sp. CT-R113]